MATLNKYWTDGSGDQLTVDYTGAPGVSNVALSSVTNVGLDRSVNVTFTTTVGTFVQVVATVYQLGLREQFTTSDGWTPSDGMFATLKN